MMHGFSQILKDWYTLNARDLPWRQTKDPYRIWISEIILQQTRVAQGMDYYHRFIIRFPDVFTLAEASIDEVMKHWEGLGYYSRARNLYEAARTIAGLGKFPDTYEGVLALKGIGAYTAAAICSFAYGLPYAVVDGNVYRVLARWQGIDTPIDSTAGKKLFAALAQSFLDKDDAATYNQAIMDFGALQCVPASPRCEICPLAEECAAYRTGRVGELPVKQHKTKVSHRYFTYIYVRSGKKIFIHRRTDDDIWKNLYELPCIETPEPVNLGEIESVPAFRAWMDGKGLKSVVLLKSGVKHVLSHQVIHADFYVAEIDEQIAKIDGYLCVEAGEIENFAFPRLLSQFFYLFLRH